MRWIVLTAIAVVGLGTAAPAASQPQAGRWTWTLYERGASLALANEIPDTPQLAAVLECTQMSLLPPSWREKVSKPEGRSRLQERMAAIRQLMMEK